MRSAASEISTCPGCGRTLEETSGGGLGCMPCLLRIGIGGEDDVSQAALGGSASKPFKGGEHFGVYEIERHPDGSLYQLGHGAMGVTYRAVDTTLQRKVALKIINVGIAGRSAEAHEGFLREARAAASLRHENIATVFQFGIREETGQCFYTMELIEGETLEGRVHRAGPLDGDATVHIARQVIAALAAAEKRDSSRFEAGKFDAGGRGRYRSIEGTAEPLGAPGTAGSAVRPYRQNNRLRLGQSPQCAS